MRPGAWWVIVLACTGCDRLLQLQDVHYTPDSDTAAPPQLIAVGHDHDGLVMDHTLGFTTPPGDRMVLLVSVGLSSSGTTTPMPAIGSITYAGMPLGRVDVIVGVPSQAGTRSELWLIADPPVGSDALAIHMLSPGQTMHVGAFVVAGVDQTEPIRGMNQLSGESDTSSTTLTSADGDLVLGIVGHGGGIDQTRDADSLYVDNVSSMWSLDNSAAATAPGVAPTATVTWKMKVSDEWQSLVVSLRPR